MKIVLLTIVHFLKFAFSKYTFSSQHLKFSFHLTLQITVFCNVVSRNLVYVCSTPAACYYIQDASNLHSFCWFTLGDKFAVFITTTWQTVPYVMQSVADLSLQRAWFGPRPVHVRFVVEKVALCTDRCLCTLHALPVPLDWRSLMKKEETWK
jgi:hypothetical protein